MIRHWKILGLGLVGWVTLAGCAGPTLQQPHPHFLGRPETLKQEPLSNPIYRLQVGDEITVKFFYNVELNDDLVIRPDGKITLQLLKDVEAAGRTPEALSQEIQEKYKGILRQPMVSVIVKKVASQKIYIGGEVRQPGLQEMTSPVTALQAIFQAGGFANTASLNDVFLLRRDEQNQTRVYYLDLSQPMNDFFLKGYDTLFVARSNIAAVDLFVEQYIDRLIPVSRSVGFSYVSDIYLP